MKSRVLISLIAILFSTASFATPTLQDVCGPNPPQGTSQQATFCQAAYANGYAWLANSNLTRVTASIAVVCAYSCMAGGLTSCGTGGAACPSAVDEGTKAYNYDTFSGNNYSEVQRTGVSSAVLNSNSSTTSLSGTQSTPPASLPGACNGVVSGNASLQDRIGCAMAMDPSIPSFVGTQQFQADFQAATGQPLQTAIGLTGSQILDNAGSVLQRAYSASGSNISTADFMKNGAGIVNAILGKLTDKDQQRFIASVVPSSLHGLLSVPAAAPAQKASAFAFNSTPGSAPATAANGDIQSVQDSARTPASLASSDSPENDRNLSIFSRVTARYGRISIDKRIGNPFTWSAGPSGTSSF